MSLKKSSQKSKKSTTARSADVETLAHSTAGDSINSDHISKIFTIIFQSRSSDDTECTTGKILMNLSDMKSLGLRAGDTIILVQKLAFIVWPSKLQSKGNAVLNKVWAPMFEQDLNNRLISITKASLQ